MFDYILQNMNQSCRICLIEKEKIEFRNINNKIFDEETVLQLIIDCAPIEVLNDDPLPQEICVNCLKKLQSFYELRQLILKSDITLKKNLLQINELPINNESNIEHKNKIKLKEEVDPESESEANFMLQNFKIKNEPVQPKYLSDFDDNSGNLVAKDEDNLKKTPDYIDTHNELYVEQEIIKEKNRLKKPFKKFKRMHECKECNKIFKKADHYTVHMTKHTGEKKYACEFCPKRFARSYVLVYHRRVHTGERPYTCDICSKSFSSPSNFYSHKKIHTGERNYKCEICDESFIQSDSLKIHVRRIHTGERPFLCEVCSSAFRSNSSLLTHKLDMHGQKEACQICNKLYSSRVLKEHVRRHKEREQGIKRFVCDQCGKRFTCSSSRKKHLLIHSGEKPFGCEICLKSFNQRSALKTHMRIHSDFMPFPCDYCSKSFRYKHHLRSHINTHHKEVVEDTSLTNCK